MDSENTSGTALTDMLIQQIKQYLLKLNIIETNHNTTKTLKTPHTFQTLDKITNF